MANDDIMVKPIIFEASQEALDGMVNRKGGEPDFTVTQVRLKSESLVLGWETKSAGFGELSVWWDGDKLEVDTEAMGRRFTREVLLKFADTLFEPKPDSDKEAEWAVKELGDRIGYDRLMQLCEKLRPK